MSRMLVLALAATLAASWLAAGCNSDSKPEEQADNGKKNDGGAPTDRPVAPAPKLVGRDDFDSKAPQVQGLFPKTAAPWAKVTEVKFYPADSLADMVDAANLAYYRPYGVDWAADAQYQHERDERQRLVVKLYHCADSADAYGLMSVASDMAHAAQIGQESRGGIGVHLHVWSGHYYLYLWSEFQQGRPFIQGMEEMARQIVTRLGGSGAKPALVRVLPTNNQVPESVHYCAGHASTRGRGVSAVIYGRALADALQLGDQDRLVLASYSVPGLRTNCVFFIARFADPARATQVHASLVTTQSEARNRFGENLLVGGQVNTCVYGTLTAAEYSWLEKSAQAGDPAEFPVLPTIGKGLSELP